MQKIALLTDSSCDLDNKTLERYNIKLLPIRIIYKNREYLDKVNITSEEMYASLKEELPTTSLPDVNYCNKVLEDLKNEGYTHVIVATVSSKLSGTLNSLRLLCEHHEEFKFEFFDTKTLGYPQGAIVLEAAKMIEKGHSVEEIMTSLPLIQNKVHGFITFNTLDYLIKGGRIGKVTGKIGNLLHLKPVVSSDEEGVLYTYCKTRGRKQSISKLKEILMTYLESSKCRVWVLSGDALEEATAFYNDIKNHPNITDVSLETIGAAMGVHTGPGALGICILEEN